METEIQAFDWGRMFVGDESLWFLLEIAFRTTFMFGYTLALVRLTGKRGMGELTPFELLLVVALGSAVGDPMFYADVPLLHAMVVVAVIVVLQRLIAVVIDHSKGAEMLLESTTTRLVADGAADIPAMRAEHFSREQLFMLLREDGVEQLGQVKRAYLEPSGRLSVWLFKEEEVLPGLPLFPEDDPDCLEPRLPGETVASDGVFACVLCGAPIVAIAGHRLGPCPVCECDKGWIEASTEAGKGPREVGERKAKKRGALGL